MQYSIESINDGVATVRYPDGSWAEIVMTSDMTEADLDDKAWEFRPKTGAAPSFASEGASRTAAEKPAPETPQAENDQPSDPQWLQDRQDAYGGAISQLEYITENGLEAWQTYVAEVKAKYPKPTE